ncbi:MAG: AAA family ATPase [Lachnospiraceae bacterium]|nr:AAA family ATPase [Lachnospiraceae bacterium]
MNNNFSLMSMAEVAKENIEWLWYPYIPYGKITIIQGNPGDGKTNLALKIAACVSSGTILPGLPELIPQNVIYLSAEDGVRDTITPRLEECGADSRNILFFKDENKPSSLSDRLIAEALESSGARLLVIDPIQAFIGSRTDMNKANEVREKLRPVGDLAEKYKCAIILIGHLNKSQGLNSIYRGIGSMDFTAISRSILLVGRHKDDANLRVFVHNKSSLCPQGASQAFRLDGPHGFEWVGGYDDVTADDILYASRNPRPRTETKLDSAVKFLKTYFSEHSEVEAQKIVELAREKNICKRTLDEAKKYVPGLKSDKKGSEWFWILNMDQTSEGGSDE